MDGRLLVDGGLLHNLPSTAFTDADDSLHFAPPTKRNKRQSRVSFGEGIYLIREGI